MTTPARPLSLDAYQAAAHETAIYPGANNDWPPIEHIRKEQALLYLVPGLCAEAGEVSGKCAKVQRDFMGVYSRADRAAVGKEIGGVLWFLAELASLFGLSLGDIAAENLAILADRAQRGVIGGSGDDR